MRHSWHSVATSQCVRHSVFSEKKKNKLNIHCRYLVDNFAPRSSYADYFLPVAAYRALFGDIAFHHLIMLSHMYALWWVGLCALMFFVWHMSITAAGITTHEFRKAVRVRCTATVAENFRSVFGPLWIVNFLLPGHIVFRQSGDGVYWPNLKLQ
jgi:hypothetical protein